MLNLFSILNNEVNFRTLRERVLLLVTGLVVIFTFFHWGILETLEQERLKIKEETANLKLIYQETERQLGVLEKNYKGKPTTAALSTNYIIKSEDMPKVLAHLFANFNGLTLIKFETVSEKNVGKTGEKGKQLYRHDLKFTFDGDYDQLLNYIKHVETMPLKVIWKSISYQIAAYPKAKIEITLIALSEQKNWIGL